jgi:hypothetical protein
MFGSKTIFDGSDESIARFGPVENTPNTVEARAHDLSATMKVIDTGAPGGGSIMTYCFTWICRPVVYREEGELEGVIVWAGDRVLCVLDIREAFERCFGRGARGKPVG